jgi:hypothetical protein
LASTEYGLEYICENNRNRSDAEGGLDVSAKQLHTARRISASNRQSVSVISNGFGTKIKRGGV